MGRPSAEDKLLKTALAYREKSMASAVASLVAVSVGASVAICVLAYALINPDLFGEPVAVVLPVLVPAVVSAPIGIYLNRLYKVLAGEHAALSAEIGLRQDVERELENQALSDELTGISNRRHFFSLAINMADSARRLDHDLTVAIFDVDNFKRVNDTHGHQMGDEVLRGVVAVADGIVRKSDVLARFGGDEFVLLAVNANTAQIQEIMERVRLGVEALRFETEGGAFGVTVSCGISDFAGADGSIDDSLYRADMALFEAKRSGRNRVVLAGKSDRRKSPRRIRRDGPDSPAPEGRSEAAEPGLDKAQ